MRWPVFLTLLSLPTIASGCNSCHGVEGEKPVVNGTIESTGLPVSEPPEVFYTTSSPRDGPTARTVFSWGWKMQLVLPALTFNEVGTFSATSVGARLCWCPPSSTEADLCSVESRRAERLEDVECMDLEGEISVRVLNVDHPPTESPNGIYAEQFDLTAKVSGAQGQVSFTGDLTAFADQRIVDRECNYSTLP